MRIDTQSSYQEGTYRRLFGSYKILILSFTKLKLLKRELKWLLTLLDVYLGAKYLPIKTI